ncbi:MAG TPA: hypothetical protein PLT12_06720, partial [Kiritimatiellia bacterium]|nr:hypothetical protein [Kiritimatiellia bacterium]
RKRRKRYIRTQAEDEERFSPRREGRKEGEKIKPSRKTGKETDWLNSRKMKTVNARGARDT